MDALHRAYGVFTETWWTQSLLVSCLVALLLSLKTIPFAAARAALAGVLVLTVGWMILDLVFYPRSHNLLPIEALFKLALVMPLLAADLYKSRNGVSSNKTGLGS